MKRYLHAAALPLILSGLLLLGWWLLKDVTIAVLQPHGEIASQQKDLLIFTVILSALVVVPVFILLIVFSIKYRESNTKAAYRPEWGSNGILESIWWGIPILIIGVLSVVTWQTSHSLDPYKAIESSNKAIEVQVVALQWKWLFIYPEYGVAAVNHLPVPTDTPLHFTLSADAPMSAFWIPSLGSQIYAMSGMSSQLNLIANDAGTYKGYSTNINGKGYSDMTFDVYAQSEASFRTWVRSAQTSGNAMNETNYKTLAKPSVKKGEFSYALTDDQLYDTIVSKYMGHNTQTIEANSSSDTYDTMEGMHQ